MKLEQICVSLELAKELKEAGYPQRALHWWGGIGNMDIWCDHVKEEMPPQEKRFTWYAAPTASELGEKLPESIKKDGENYLIFQTLVNGYVKLGYWSIKEPNVFGEVIGSQSIQRDKSEADARTTMLLYLAKEKLINLKRL